VCGRAMRAGNGHPAPRMSTLGWCKVRPDTHAHRSTPPPTPPRTMHTMPTRCRPPLPPHAPLLPCGCCSALPPHALAPPPPILMPLNPLKPLQQAGWWLVAAAAAGSRGAWWWWWWRRLLLPAACWVATLPPCWRELSCMVPSGGAGSPIARE